MGSPQVHTGYLTFFLKKTLIQCFHDYGGFKQLTCNRFLLSNIFSYFNPSMTIVQVLEHDLYMANARFHVIVLSQF